MTRNEIQSEIHLTANLVSSLLAKRPDDKDLLGVEKGLKRITEMVARHWPLSPEDRKQINMGLYAVRALEGGPYGELPHMLAKLDADLKRD